MAYATVEQLAKALRVNVTAGNSAQLLACLEAASEEIDHQLGRPVESPLPDPPPDLVVQTCVARGVEWWKASDAAFGALGFDGTGVLTAPRDAFARHAASLIPYQATFGVA